MPEIFSDEAKILQATPKVFSNGTKILQSDT